MQPILKIDLSTKEINQLKIPESFQQEYLGGASLAARLLYDHISPDVDALSPEASLLFLNGPLTGTLGPAVGRFVIAARSPATGLWGESNCGGFWGPELRKAGFLGLWITGCASEPVYLWIHGSRADDVSVEFKQASSIWGKDTYETQEAVSAELAVSRARVAVIGPAGEAQIPYALILTDHGRVAGRTGMGAVMGSKNLKAIAVKGDGKVPIADGKTYTELSSKIRNSMKSEPLTYILKQLGTAGVADYMDYLGDMPKRYFSARYYDKAINISGSKIAETIQVGVSACHGCTIACGRVVRLKDGIDRKGPEYETLVGFGPNLLISDPIFMTRINELCDRYGLDSISLSNTIGLAFKLYEMGVLTEDDTAGMALEWGDEQVVERLVHVAVKRQGFGECLAEGAKALAERFGAPDEAVQVNGLEVPYHDPRACSGMALVYATSPRGACHNQSNYFVVDIGQTESSFGLELYSRFAGKEKSSNVAIHQDVRTLYNSLVMCKFANVAPDQLVSLINAACGFDWTVNDVRQCGERGWNLKRVINNRLGITGDDDKLPTPLLRAVSDARTQQDKFVPDIDDMLVAYYQARGWDPDRGCPTRDKLHELDLDWVSEDIWDD